MATSSNGTPPSLGCGVYEVYFKTRGGDLNVCRARNLTSVSFNRMINEVSEATIIIALNDQTAEQCGCISTLDPWANEVAIYRDGTEVWCGPIVNMEIDLETLTATFMCKDLMTWTDHRWVELPGTDYDVEEVDSAEVFDWLLTHAYLKEAWNMEWFMTATGIPIDRFYPAFEPPDRWGGTYPIIGSELRSLAEHGIDWTVIRRTMFGGALQTNPPLQFPIILLDQHWAKLPKLNIVGSGMATEVAVAGGNGGYYGWEDDQMWIERPYDYYRDRYGLLQSFTAESTLDEEDTTLLPNAITQTAYGRRELKKAPYTYIKGGQLANNAPVDFDTLIPGAIVNVKLNQTCRTVEDDYRLYQVDVNFSGDLETVAVQLTPQGAGTIRGTES